MNEVITLHIPNSNEHYTYKDYELWEGRWELIDGVPYNMSPAPSTEHQSISGELYFTLRSFLSNGDCRVFHAPFDVRFSEIGGIEEVTTVVQPDLSIYCNPNRIDDKGGIGAPDLIVEILSPSTALKDRNQKYKLYERRGVKEYWIVDSSNKTIEVYGLDDSGRFNKRDVFGTEIPLTSFLFEELTVDLTSIFAK